jgi:hypothetical protein
MKENLEKLRFLTEKLSVRDEKRFHELELYQSFFNSIPVKTFVWSVDTELNIKVKNKNPLKDDCVASLLSNGTIKDAFSCKKMNLINVEMHQAALGGDSQLYLCYENEITFLTSLIPVGSGDNTVVYGCSWDVTNLVKIISALNSGKTPGSIVKSIEDITKKSDMFKLISRLEVPGA